MLYNNTQERENEKRLIREILEYTMSREKSEKTAARLIEEFGCIKNILSAESSDLQSGAGLSEKDALTLSFLGKLITYTTYESFGKNPQMTDVDVRKRYVRATCGIMPYEDSYIFLLDKKDRIIKAIPISHGIETSITVNARFVGDMVMKNGASGVILVHTHPTGTAQPSHEDIKSTGMLSEFFKKLEIRFVDHIIVGRNSVCSMKELDML